MDHVLITTPFVMATAQLKYSQCAQDEAQCDKVASYHCIEIIYNSGKLRGQLNSKQLQSWLIACLSSRDISRLGWSQNANPDMGELVRY